MFDKLYGAFAKAAKSLSEKELNEKDIDGALFDLEMSLLEADVAGEVVDAIKSDLKRDLIGTKVEKSQVADVIRTSLISSISTLFDSAGRVDILGMIDEKKKRSEPFLILFVGINGTGKTTSLAKMAYMLQQKKYSVVVAASDTFRAGAIEQLKGHTKRLGIKIVAQNYNSDPAAVARDAVLYARAHKTDCVLIDTAGRMQTSKNLMEQIAKIAKVVNPDIKIFVGDSLAGNDTVNQAREFFEHTKFNASILTKADADARGGAALSIAKVTSVPIIYVGVGQEYQDLKPFEKNTFLNIVFGEGDEKINAQAKEASLAGMQENPQMEKESGRKEVATIKAEKNENAAAAAAATTTDTKPTQLSPPPTTAKPAKDTLIKEPSQTPPESPLAELPASPRPPAEPKEAKEPEPAKEPLPPSDDPFYGIADSDIAQYSDMFDVPPPENDRDAQKLADKIRKWIKAGRLNPDEGTYKAATQDKEHKEIDWDQEGYDRTKSDQKEKHGGGGKDQTGRKQHDKKDKPAKKHGMFGFFKR